MLKRTLLPLLCVLLAACDQPAPPAQQADASATEAPWLAAEDALAKQLDNERAERLRRLTVSASGFGDSIDGLLDDPTDERLNTARQAWARLYQHFNESFVVLVCQSTLQPVNLVRLERADSFPILPGYIDGLSEWPGSGIVNDMAMPLNRDSLLEQQAATLEGEASIGLQVIHFLLHGEPDAARPVSDFAMATELDEESVGELADQPNNRRRLYLQLATDLLVEDLLLLSRAESPLAITAECPTGALRETVARLIRLESLGNNTQVSQDYLAADARKLAISGLQAAIQPWLTQDGSLVEWLDLRAPGNSGKLAPPPAPDSDARITALQALHAALAAAERALRTRQ